MAEVSARQPLLPNGEAGHTHSKTTSFLLTSAKLLLKSLMWVVFITWITVIFFKPTKIVGDSIQSFFRLTERTVFGITGSIFLGFSGPILIITFLAFMYLAACPRDTFERKKGKFPRFRLWTFPVLIDGPFGVVSAAELIGIVLFATYVLWNAIAYIIQADYKISDSSVSFKEKCLFMLQLIGGRFGSIGMFCLAILFLPVARGSILLRLIDIPFEHATRYHVWLGHLTMVLFTLHGLCYVLAWSLQGTLFHKILEWKDIGVAYLPGVISLTSGLLMWVTSLYPVRKNYFELFFYTHQLYVVFVVFLALHVGDFIFSMAAGAIFLFILDRFLRFCQSRPTVDLISAACHPCGTVELIFSKPANLRYNALSFLFVQVRELSWLQWHPFSVSSSPLDGTHHIAVLIKVLGEWTEKLRNIISNAPEKIQTNLKIEPQRLTASVEGPYGHESPYYLTYEHLILVAGGIGISPFLAIMSDILHRVNQKRPCLPRNVLVVWAVKKSKELSLLSAVNAQPTTSSVSDRIHLDIKTFVTQELEPSLEEGKPDGSLDSLSFSMTNGKSMSCLVGTGNNVWSGIYFIVSALGFIGLFGLLEIYYVIPFKVTAWWFKGLLFIMCMVMGVIMLGGIVIFFWNKWEKRCSSYEKWTADDEKSSSVQYNGQVQYEAKKANLASFQTIQYGCRPDFKAIFSSFSDRVSHADVGVIVCGPPGLQAGVARECRSQNMTGKWNQPVFHFNSHSFDL